MKTTIKLFTALILIGGFVAFMGCEDDEPGQLEIVSIEATGTDLESGETVTKDLNAATAPKDMPIDAVIEAEFSKNLDSESIDAGVIHLTKGDESVELEVSVDGEIVTIAPVGDLERGTEYSLKFDATIKADDGGSFTSIERSFKTAGQGIVTPPQSDHQIAYFTFNETLEDYTGNYGHGNKAEVTGYVEDRFGYMNSAAEFNGTTDIVDVANTGDLINPSTTISFWMRVDLEDENYENGMFLMGAMAEFGYFFELGKNENGPWLKMATRHKEHPDATGDFGSATAWGDAIRGDGTQTDATNWEGDLSGMLDKEWAHVVLSYNESNSMKRAYINATKVWEMDLSESDEWKMKEMHLDTENATDYSMDVGIGFAGSSDNHSTGWADYQTYVDDGVAKTFSGYMDDVRFFNTALTAADVQALYDSEKPE